MMRQHIMLDVTFEDCERIADLNDLRKLGSLLADNGFQMVVYPEPQQGVTLADAEIGEYLVETWPETVRSWLQKSGSRYPVSYGRNLLALGMEDLQWSLLLAYNSKAARTAVHIGGLVDFVFRDQRSRVEPYARRLHELAWALTPDLGPALTSVDERDNLLALDDVLKRKLKHINWVNIFGPPYVQKYGREFLLGLPGHHTEEWPDGSIYYQLSPTFVVPDLKAARTLRREVVEYCAQAGLKVTCKAPYQLVKVAPAPPEEEEPIPDESVQVYMQEMLRTTLVLKDGTRVKPVSVPWEVLTPVQQQIALDAIKTAAIAEIREHRDKRIRFEFNTIPDELDQMLVELAGWDNPGFEWEEVDMRGET